MHAESRDILGLLRKNEAAAMMTRSLYDNIEMERYGRHHQYSMQQWDRRNTALQLSHADRLQMRSAPTCRPDRIPSDNEQDSRDGISQTRRQRIAVACARCRKRKIKCSGDPGNGMGCQNCRNAGSETCNFFRVGSHDLGAALSGQQQQSPNISLSGYVPHTGMERQSYITIPTAGTYPARGYHQAHSPLSVTTRNLTGSDYALQYDSDSPSDAYGLQTAPLTVHDPYSGYFVNDMPTSSGRTWPENSNIQRFPAAYSHYTEQETSTGYPTSQLPYPSPLSARQPLGAPDNTSSFNVVSLQYSLPNAATDRVLPNPMANSNSRSQNYPTTANLNTLSHRANDLGISGLPILPHGGLPSTHVSKPYHPTWLPENVHDVRSNSVPSVSSGIDLIAPPPSKASTVATTSSSAASESSPRSYIPRGTSPISETSPTIPVPTYNSNTSVYSSAPSTRPVISTGSSHDLHHPASHQSLHGAASHADLTIARQNSQVNLYSYTRDLEARDDRDGTLVNGQDYHPLTQSQPTRPHASDFVRHEACVEARRPALLRQTSMHSIHSQS